MAVFRFQKYYAHIWVAWNISVNKIAVPRKAPTGAFFIRKSLPLCSKAFFLSDTSPALLIADKVHYSLLSNIHSERRVFVQAHQQTPHLSPLFAALSEGHDVYQYQGKTWSELCRKTKQTVRSLGDSVAARW
ncbi:hypothetical protein D3C78_1158400 [compost metagenome]